MSDRTCSVEGCERQLKVKSRGWCWTHYKRWQKHGSPDIVLPWPGSGVRGPESPRWVGDDAPYFSAHRRISQERGKAREYACEHCRSQAREWAYDHADPDAKYDEVGRPYSLDVMHYIPLCKGCHQRFDRAQIGVADDEHRSGAVEARRSRDGAPA